MFWPVVALAAVQSWGSLWVGIRYWNYVREHLNADPPPYYPPAAVIVPCRGVDPELRENVRALRQQEYPEYEVIFVLESHADPAYAVIREVIEREPGAPVTILEAGRARDCGQKVHNLLVALEHLETRSSGTKPEVYVFTDSDALRDRYWLRHLIAPLRALELGATTGYRWYIPTGSLASLLRSLWNAPIVTALGPHPRNFAWGGSMALRRETADRIRLREYWRGSVSDDYRLTEALRRAGGSVVFVPQCLLPSLSECSLRDVLEFTTRQIIITRRYAFHLWAFLMLGTSLFLTAFFWSGARAIAQFASKGEATEPVLAFLAIYVPGVLKAMVRTYAIERILTAYREQLRPYRAAHWFLYPLASMLFFYNCLIAAFSRRISWRGIRYELRAPDHTIVLS
ncbi:MAG: glycosyltransferase [Blastocatellia bacterium]|nr:glycosyltransferase [Blastocatellia bacterium]MCS7157627.1 glycosyltransferase [Blastocatellia bacterium]MCX7751892.1 glycosyltransferase [Blastocatellia bacterium]MDW8166998.1 glycosyltransferase [Acidobacteriota bacterium]MDW8257102.1 glycosyltransferase [Acidobacteriota bacterium]